MCTLSDMISASSERMMPCMDNHLQLKSQSPSSSSSSRILDIPCKVCGDYSSGKHYNIFACDGCAGFFKRSIRRNRKYQCKAKEEGTCVIDKTHRNQCRACRLHKCQEAGMNKDAVQHERGPRNSTLRKQQMSNCYGEFRDRILMTPQGVLNLTLPKPASPTPRIDTTFSMIPPSSYINNGLLSMPRLPSMVPLSPIIPSPFLTPTAICEYAARLLFTNVQWARSLTTFTSLPFSDQLLLLEESWRELFVLGAAQFLPLVELSSLVHACGILERDEENPTLFLHKVKEFQDILASVRMYQLDHHEYSCLRAIMLFKTQFEKASSSTSSPPQAETKVLTEPAKIATIQDDTQLSLNKHIQSLHPGQPLRFGKLLMLLPTLRSVETDTIEELFFRKTIGNIPISKIICDMYKSQAINVS